MRKLLVIVLGCLLLGCAAGALAQSVDLAVGGGTAAGTQMNGGFLPSVSLTAMFSPHVGVNAEFAVRANNINSFDLGQYRPSTSDVNLALRMSPRRWTPELLVGYGAVRTTGFGCDNFPNERCLGDPSQLQGGLHVGGGVKTYFRPHWFVRLEAHYFYRPTLNSFGYNVGRFGVALGYSFGGR